jgi:hypothetical protein
MQIGAGAGDRDSRLDFRDGFTELVKKQDKSTIDKIILIEPNLTNIPELTVCWKDYPQAVIYQIGICLESAMEKSITFFYVEEDAPHFQVFSMNKEHVQKHYPDKEIKSKIVQCKTLIEFLNENLNGASIDTLAIDIEGIDAELVLETDWTKIDCRYISIEHLHLGDNSEKVKQKLIDAGYKYNGDGIDHKGYDWSFIK